MNQPNALPTAGTLPQTLKSAEGLVLEILKQGGTWITARAIARKGSKLLAAYSITNGEARERWLPASRYRNLEGDVETLPRYKAASCKATTLEEPVRASDFEAEHGSAWRVTCPTCGTLHRVVNETREVEVSEARADEIEAAGGYVFARLDRCPSAPRGECLRETNPELAAGRPLFVRENWVLGLASAKLPDVLVEPKPAKPAPVQRQEDRDALRIYEADGHAGREAVREEIRERRAASLETEEEAPSGVDVFREETRERRAAAPEAVETGDSREGPEQGTHASTTDLEAARTFPTAAAASAWAEDNVCGMETTPAPAGSRFALRTSTGFVARDQADPRLEAPGTPLDPETRRLFAEVNQERDGDAVDRLRRELEEALASLDTSTAELEVARLECMAYPEILVALQAYAPSGLFTPEACALEDGVEPPDREECSAWIRHFLQGGPNPLL